MAKTYHRPSFGRRWIERDIGSGVQTFHVEEDLGHYTIDHIGLETDYVHREAYRIRDDDPLSAEIEISFVITIGRGDWKARSESWTVMRGDKTDFHIEAKLNSFEGDKPVFSRERKERIPRCFQLGKASLSRAFLKLRQPRCSGLREKHVEPRAIGHAPFRSGVGRIAAIGRGHAALGADCGRCSRPTR